MLAHCLRRHSRLLTFGVLLRVQRLTRIPLAVRPCREPRCGVGYAHSAHLTPLARAALGGQWTHNCPERITR
jgi:hypothetical protein